MTRDVRSLQKLLKAQDLKKRATESQLGMLKIRLGELHAEEEACLALLQNESFNMDFITRSVTRRLSGLAARKENMARRIMETQEQVKLETLRSDKVLEWLDNAELQAEEERLADVAQDDVANKIHASG
ncbi:MAG: hypothetical protein JNM45_07905 [Rhizobiales bacterium]|nr:hypothetical protein [Hyphomicrobiales bacterium]